jgi:opacity protein-like surface antigen
MKRRSLRMPSPALVIALIALFVALSGTAIAAGVVPLAKRALVADNAKKFGNQTPKEFTGGLHVTDVGGLVSVASATWSLQANQENDFSATCKGSARAIGGGYDNGNGAAFNLDSRPSPDGASWRIVLVDASTTAPANGNVYAICLK